MIVLLRARPSPVFNNSNKWEFLLDRDGRALGAKLEDTFSCGGDDPRRQQDGGARTETWL